MRYFENAIFGVKLHAVINIHSPSENEDGHDYMGYISIQVIFYG